MGHEVTCVAGDKAEARQVGVSRPGVGTPAACALPTAAPGTQAAPRASPAHLDSLPLRRRLTASH